MPPDSLTICKSSVLQLSTFIMRVEMATNGMKYVRDNVIRDTETRRAIKGVYGETRVRLNLDISETAAKPCTHASKIPMSKSLALIQLCLFAYLLMIYHLALLPPLTYYKHMIVS